MPQYKKVFDIGTYTGNGGQYRVGIPTLRGVGPTGTQVAGSLRFRSSNSAYLQRTLSSASSQTKGTWSFWVKRGSLPGSRQTLFSTKVSSLGNNALDIEFYSGNQLNVTMADTSNTNYLSNTNNLYRDVSVWYHVVISIDTTQATSTNRLLAWVNGVAISWSSYSVPTQNSTMRFGDSTYPHSVGVDPRDGTYFDGYLSEFNYIDGQALTPSSFGEYNSDGIWVPKVYSGSYGTNGFYLKFASGAIGTDSSGNSNTFTPYNFNTSTANTTYDIMTDSPTDYLSGSMTTANNAANYPTVNPNNKYSTITLTNGNLTVTPSEAAYRQCLATTPFPSTGLYYLEINSTNQNYVVFGVATQNAVLSERTGTSATGYAVGASNNQWDRFNNGTSTGNFWTIGALTNPVYQIAIDTTNGKLWMGYNNTWLDSSGGVTGNPSTGANATFTIDTTRTYYAAFGGYNSNSPVLNVNFGQRAFTYTPPTSFLSLNTYNYPRPADSALWFYGDTPDLMWIKNRSTTGLHTLTDTVRGAGLNLVTSSSAAETSYPAVTEMNKFGMSVINDGTSIVNGSGNSMVYWGWKAGSNTSSTSVTNTDGFDTSQVSVNRSAGFSVVTYTGTGTNMSVGHGLGAAPNLIIIKARDASQNWTVYHSSVGTAKYLILNSTAATTSAVDYFTGVTSTLWSMTGAATSMATNGTKYVAYCWTAIPGYSSFGSYTGNGSADGPFIYCGFLPRFIMTKGSSGITDWVIHDTGRETYNQAASSLYPNTTGAEASLEPFDILSNGFKIRGTAGNVNNNGTTYIYAAFASIPFKFSRAR